MTEHRPIRRQWCAMLAKLVSPSFPADAQTALLDMLPALQHLPDSLFTPATLTEVALAKRRQSVPAFDEIVAALNAYRARYVPDPTLRLAARPNADLPPGRKPPCPDEVAIVADMLTSWKREMQEARLAREQAERDDSRRTVAALPDVSLKGEALAQVRAARGVAA